MKGAIVQRLNGWAPMVVTGISQGSHYCYVRYCNSLPETENYYTGDNSLRIRDIKLVTDPFKQLRCAGLGRQPWWKRMNEEQLAQLRRQMILAGVSTDTLDQKLGITPSGNQEENTMTRLYQTKEETPRFGVKLATNSAGKAVLEMKGTGETLTFDYNQIEEVKPFTVRVRFFQSKTGSSSDREYEYIAKKGSVQIGDILEISGGSSLATVVKVDTKSDLATTVLKGRRVMMESIDELDIGE